MKKIKIYNMKLIALALIVSFFASSCNNEDISIPTGDFTFEINDANPLLVSFNATTENAVTVEWNFGDGSLSIALNSEHEYSEGGNYNVKLSIFSEAGTTPTVIEKTVTLVLMPTGDFSYEVTDLTASFTSTTTNAVSYSWDFGDGETSTEENPSHTYANAGQYSVIFNVIGEEGSTPVVVTKTIAVAIVEKIFEPIVVENADFELPGDAKYTNWADVPGWNSDTDAGDSGVEANGWWATDDDYAGYRYNGDPVVYNLTPHTIIEGEEFLLNVDAFDIWNGSKFTVNLYYDSGDGARHIFATKSVDLVASTWNSVELSAIATTESIGANIGIEISSDSADGSDAWTGFDDIQLFSR